METQLEALTYRPPSTDRASHHKNDTSTIVLKDTDIQARDYQHLERLETLLASDLLGTPDVSWIKIPAPKNPAEEQPVEVTSETQIVQRDPGFESALYASRVYSRTTHRHSMSSLVSRDTSVAGLSVLSNLGLAQISSLSVISLPIFSYDLWNHQRFEDSTRKSVDISLNEKRTGSFAFATKIGPPDTRNKGLAAR